MSDLLRQSVNGPATPPQQRVTRTRPADISPPGWSDAGDDQSSSDSSASSVASVVTVRPSSREHEAGQAHWTRYFDQELFLEDATESQSAQYHVYLTPPADPSKSPIFIFCHGAGASGLSFAVLAEEIRIKLPNAGVLSLEARGHGSVVIESTGGKNIVDFSLESLTKDALAMIRLTKEAMGWTQLPPTVLVGHSLGGAIVTNIASAHFKAIGTSMIGYCVLDVVEGSALEALGHMKTYLSSRPREFDSVDEAIQWHLRSRTIRCERSANASVPSLLVPSPGSEKLMWHTDLAATSTWWEEWFKGMSQKFLAGRGAKMLILAGTDRLDRELMIGQMQGKFQLVVIPEAGHFVHEDVPARTAELLVEFFKRNDRSNLVLPPKVSDLIKQGKKV